MKNSRTIHFRQLGKIVFSSFIILSSLPTLAEEPSRHWVNIGPKSEEKVFSYAPSPSTQGVIYAFSRYHKLVRSEDSGQTWSEVETQGHVNFSSTVRDVGFSSTSIPNTRGVDSVLRVDAVDPQKLYAINNGLLSKSSDGGIHWQKMSQNITIDPGTFFLLNPPPMTKLLKGLVYTNNGIRAEKHLVTSIDGGENWIVAEKAIQGLDGQTIAIEGVDPKNPLILYGTNIAEAEGAYFSDKKGYYPRESDPLILHKSIDGGLSWFKIQPTSSRQYSGILKIHPANSNILYAKFNDFTNAIYSDLSDLGIHVSESLSMNPLYMRSDDGGNNWEPLAPVDPELERTIAPLTLDPSNTAILYADLLSTFGGSIIGGQHKIAPNMTAKSIDSGKSWKIIPQEGENPSYKPASQGVLVNPQNSQNLFYKSRVSYDGGDNWVNKYAEIKGTGGQLAVAESAPNIMYLATPSSLYSSVNAGNSWENNTENGCIQLAINPKNDQNLLCLRITTGLYSSFSVKESLHKSLDAGNTWSLIHNYEYDSTFSGRELEGFVTYAKDGQTIYYRQAHQLKKSTNKGESWDTLNTNLGFSNIILVDPKDAYTFYTTTEQGRGVYKSTDGGESWTKQLDIPSNALTNNLLQHPSRPERLLIVAAFDPRGTLELSKFLFRMNVESQDDLKVRATLINAEIKTFLNLTLYSGKFDPSLFSGYSPTVEITSLTKEQIDELITLTPLNNHSKKDIVAFLTDDGGENWSALPKSFTDKVHYDNLNSLKGVAFNPRNPDGILSSFSGSLYETTDLGVTWNKVAEGFKPNLKLFSDKVYSADFSSVYSLAPATISTDDKNCLFAWAEQQYPSYFSAALAGTQVTDDYAYRYYNDSNNYLGVFQDKKVHVLQADLTDKINDVGYFEYFQHLAKCQ